MENHGMIIPAIIFVFIARVSGVCEDDLVPLEAAYFPAVWNIGNIPHLFINSAHLRGVSRCSDFKIGLDAVKTSLSFCPVDMTIYGNVSAGRVQLLGSYTSNLDFISQGSHVLGHGDGFFNLTFTNLQLRNLVAPIRYSTATKRLQIEEMQYEVYDDLVSPLVTGFDVDEKSERRITGEEFKRIDQTSSFPAVFETVRAILNTNAQRGILVTAVKRMFTGVLSI